MCSYKRAPSVASPSDDNYLNENWDGVGLSGSIATAFSPITTPQAPDQQPPAFQLNEEGWRKLNSRWAYFFIFLALLNEVVWRTQPEATWVNFKVWGMLPITIIFTAMQLPLINRYKL